MFNDKPLPDFTELALANNANISILNKRVKDVFDFSLRVRNGLQNQGITFVGELVQKSYGELRKPNFGDKSVKEVINNLKLVGLHLGMNTNGDSSDLISPSIIDASIAEEELKIKSAMAARAKLIWLRDESPTVEKKITDVLIEAGIDITDPVKTRVKELAQFAGQHLVIK